MRKSNGNISAARMLSGDEIAKEARNRKSKQEFDSIPKGYPIPEGWKVYREFVTKTRIFREKNIDAQLKDKVWLLFSDMGLPRISASGYTLKLERGETKLFQPAVVAQDDEIVFFAITLSQPLPARKKQMDHEVNELVQNQNTIRTALKQALEISRAQFVFIIATENIIWEEDDLKLAKDNGILVWDEYDILALQELSKIAGEGARYQIYNRIFYKKKIKAFEVRVPALRAKMGGKIYYCMAMTPEHLLKIAYVHQRSASSTIMDISNAYQRALQPSRVREINRYIDEGGFFPNSVILNFTINFPKVERIGSYQQLSGFPSAEPVMVTLPPYYGSAWIIDGQHRIYGYADSALKNSETIPVVAFVDESIEDQAKMFIDVNENQKRIAADLRWDLYEDLYLGAQKPREQILFAVSKISKKLNDLPPFLGSISIPSKPKKGHISLTTLCSRIHSEGFIDPEEGELFEGDILHSIDFAATRIALLFQFVAKSMPIKWEAADDHYIHTNAGIVVLLGIFRDILRNLGRDEIRDLQRLESTARRFLTPVINHLLAADKVTIDRYRRAGGALGASRQIQAELTKLITKAGIGYRSRFLEEYERQAETVLDRIKAGGCIAVLREGEGTAVEIKGSVFLDVDNLLKGDGKRVKLPAAEESFLKTVVAFLNSTKASSVLIIGAIESDRYTQQQLEKLGSVPEAGRYRIIGVNQEVDYKGFDQYELRLRDLIASHIAPDIVPSISVDQFFCEDRPLAVLKVNRDLTTWHYLDRDKFFIRDGNRTRELRGREADEYKRRYTGRVE